MTIRAVRMIFAGVALAGVAAPAVAAEPLKIEGVGISREVACDGEDVGVYGAENKIELTGACGRVVVHGADHEVTLEKAKELAVSGSKNRVRGGETGGLKVDVDQNEVEATVRSAGGPAEIAVYGAQQKVRLTLAGASTLNVQGADNAVEWAVADGAPKPKISAGGAANTIRQRK